MFRLHLSLLVSLIFVIHFVACSDPGVCADAKEGEQCMEGICGLSGEPVECVDHSDCYYSMWADFCTWVGLCIHSGDACGIGAPVCGYGQICVSDRCRTPCDTHEDCPLPEAICQCLTQNERWPDWQGGWCRYTRCDLETGSCPVGSTEIPGFLICLPDEKPGDCQRWRPEQECTQGYEPNGNLDCVII
jgi:hypothetical protein